MCEWSGSGSQYAVASGNPGGRLPIHQRGQRFLVLGPGQQRPVVRLSWGKGWNVGIDHEKIRSPAISPGRKPEKFLFKGLIGQTYTSKYIQTSSKETEKVLLMSAHPTWVSEAFKSSSRAQPTLQS